jgi:hypothetical protein
MRPWMSAGRGLARNDGRVDGRQCDQHDRDHQQHLSGRSVCGSRLGGPSRSAAIAAARQDGDDPLGRDGDAGNAQQDAARPPGDHPQAEEQGHGPPPRERDQPARTPGSSGGVGQSVDGAGAGGADGGNEGRHYRDPQGHGRDYADRGHGQRCTGAAEETGPGSPSNGAASHPTASPASRNRLGRRCHPRQRFTQPAARPTWPISSGTGRLLR